MKKTVSFILVSVILMLAVCSASYAFEIVLPDDEFEEEVTSVRGDVDGNGIVNMDDFSTLSKIVNGAEIEIAGSADIDLNGTVDMNDFAMLSKVVNGAEIF